MKAMGWNNMQTYIVYQTLVVERLQEFMQCQSENDLINLVDNHGFDFCHSTIDYDDILLTLSSTLNSLSKMKNSY